MAHHHRERADRLHSLATVLISSSVSTNTVRGRIGGWLNTWRTDGMQSCIFSPVALFTLQYLQRREKNSIESICGF